LVEDDDADDGDRHDRTETMVAAAAHERIELQEHRPDEHAEGQNASSAAWASGIVVAWT
jgi:hypothetical protein